MKVNNTESRECKKIYVKRTGLSLAIVVFLLGLITILSTGFLSCAGAGTEYSEVIINVGGGSKAITWPPDDIVAYTLTVSGSDFGTLEVAFPGTATSVGMLVPKGTNRTVELEAYKDPASASAIITWRGRSTVDLESDSVQVDLPMRTGETKLVVADTSFEGGAANAKIFQINDIDGLDWGTQQIAASDLSLIWSGTYYFWPYDLELDNRGRIYVANNGQGNGALVWRIDSILDTTEEILIDTSGSPYNDSGYEALAIDQINGYIYVSVDTSNTIYRSDLDGNGLTTLNTTTGVEEILLIYGMVVDSDGMLYISGQNPSDQPRIFKYNPETEKVVDTYFNSNFDDVLFDIRVDDDYVYVTNMEGSDDWMIIRVNKNFSNAIGYGNNVSSENHSPGAFYDPRKFVAITNRKITVVDDSGPLDKLIQMDDIEGSNWQTFPPSGDGQSFFRFYVC